MTRENLLLLDFHLGGVLGLRTSSQQLPLVTKVINKFACARVPLFGYTTFSIFNNVATGPHKDFHNAHLDNVIVSLGGFTGGGVWIEESGGSTPCPDDPSRLGRVLNFRNGTIRLRAKSIVHSTMPWKGNRTVLILFSAKHPSDISSDLCLELRNLGFPIDLCGVSALAAEAPRVRLLMRHPMPARLLMRHLVSVTMNILLKLNPRMIQKIKFQKGL